MEGYMEDFCSSSPGYGKIKAGDCGRQVIKYFFASSQVFPLSVSYLLVYVNAFVFPEEWCLYSH